MSGTQSPYKQHQRQIINCLNLSFELIAEMICFPYRQLRDRGNYVGRHHTA